MLKCMALGALLLMAQFAQAEIVSSGETGFSLKVVVTSRASAEDAYLAFTQIDRWWDPNHTYTGDAANLTLNLRPGGNFVETLPGIGFVTHLELAYVEPGSEIRLLGGLGPLQPMGAHGAMTVTFRDIEGGSEITMLYNVVGYSAEGMKKFAPVVDAVQAQQMRRLATYANSL